MNTQSVSKKDGQHLRALFHQLKFLQIKISQKGLR